VQSFLYAAFLFFVGSGTVLMDRPRGLLRGILVLALLISIGASNVLPASGQPGFGESCAPPNPAPGCPEPPELMWVQASVGGGQLYVEDKMHSQKGQVTDNDMPIYLVLILPSDATTGSVAIIQYYPPGYDVRNYIEPPWQTVTGGGSKTFGGYVTGAADPRGKYAFRAIVWWWDSGVPPRLHYAEPVAFMDYLGPQPTPTVTVTTPGPGPDYASLIMPIIVVIALVIVAVTVAFMLGRRGRQEPKR